ncbi:RloB family protein [Streptomyces sp. BE20]|uniref:RloB family protein n=1 Tax=Streptomyces sp. BE20 TaxID=3002525 RepID=UPI003FA7E23E
MRRGKPLGTKKQNANTREQERRFLVYCEGEVTEKIYLRGLVKDLRSKPISLKIGNTHGEPWSLVNSAIAHAARADESFDEVWCALEPPGSQGTGEGPQGVRPQEEGVRLRRRQGPDRQGPRRGTRSARPARAAGRADRVLVRQQSVHLGGWSAGRPGLPAMTGHSTSSASMMR